MERMKKTAGWVLGLALFVALGNLSVAHAADNKTAIGGSLPINKDTNVKVTKNSPYDTYLAYGFKPTTDKGYYYFLVNSTQPERKMSIYLSPSADYNSKTKSADTTEYFELGDHLGGENNLEADKTYYILMQRMVDVDYTSNVTLAFLSDKEPDTGAEAKAYTAGATVSASIDGVPDKDVWKFTTGEEPCSLTAKAEGITVECYLYSDADLSKSVDHFSVTQDGRTVVLSKLEKNKTYYVVYKYENYHIKGKRVNYSFSISGAAAENGEPEMKLKTSIQGANVALSATSFTYNGKAQKPVIKTIGGKTLKAGVDYSAKWSNASSKNAGTYSVTITGKGNYTGSTKATYKIKAKKVTPSVTVKDVKYTGKAQKPAVTVKVGKTTLKKGTDYTAAYSNNVKVGQASVKVTLKGNYSGSKTAAFRILPKTASISMTILQRRYYKPVVILLNGADSSGGTVYQIQYRILPPSRVSKAVLKKWYPWKTILTKAKPVKIHTLKRNKNYQFRVRAIKLVNRKLYIGAWSAEKTVKITR